MYPSNEYDQSSRAQVAAAQGLDATPQQSYLHCHLHLYWHLHLHWHLHLPSPSASAPSLPVPMPVAVPLPLLDSLAIRPTPPDSPALVYITLLLANLTQVSLAHPSDFDIPSCLQ